MTGNLGGRKLFVGGLPPKVDERALREVFSQYWSVDEVILVTDRETRKSRGFGYVVFGSEREAKEAMNSMSGERGKKFFDHEMTIEYARDKESTAPRQMRAGGRGGFSQRGRPPPRGSSFRGPPGRGPPTRPRDAHPPARGREPHMPPPSRGHPPRGPHGEPRRGPPPPDRYDDYGPPDRSYPPRDYDRGGYGDRERERPPSYSSEHYGNRYPPQERGGSGGSYPSSDRGYGPPMDRGYGSSDRYSNADRYSTSDRGFSDRYGASDDRYPGYDRGYGGDRQDRGSFDSGSSGGGYGSSDRGYGGSERSYPPPDRGYGPPPERPRAGGYGGAPADRPYSSGSYSGGRDW